MKPTYPISYVKSGRSQVVVTARRPSRSRDAAHVAAVQAAGGYPALTS